MPCLSTRFLSHHACRHRQGTEFRVVCICISSPSRPWPTSALPPTSHLPASEHIPLNTKARLRPPNPNQARDGNSLATSGLDTEPTPPPKPCLRHYVSHNIETRKRAPPAITVKPGNHHRYRQVLTPPHTRWERRKAKQSSPPPNPRSHHLCRCEPRKSTP